MQPIVPLHPIVPSSDLSTLTFETSLVSDPCHDKIFGQNPDRDHYMEYISNT